MSWCIRYGYVVEIKHVNFCFCAWLHEQGRRRSAKQQKPNVPLHRAHFGEIFPEEAFAFLCPLRWPIKFRYCEKTIKLVTSKQSMRFLQFFVTFLEYPNFLVQFLLVERRKWFHKYFCKQCLHKDLVFIKFGFSEKATKFEKIFVVLLTRASCSVRKIFQNKCGQVVLYKL